MGSPNTLTLDHYFPSDVLKIREADIKIPIDQDHSNNQQPEEKDENDGFKKNDVQVRAIGYNENKIQLFNAIKEHIDAGFSLGVRMFFIAFGF